MVAEILFPESKPETEWVRGRPLRKASPQYRHAKFQALLSMRLTAWAKGRGRVDSERRFRVNPPGEAVRPLLPDVAYLSYARLGAEEDAAAQIPLGAPNVAVEILSPDDREIDVMDKVSTYLRVGCELVASCMMRAACRRGSRSRIRRSTNFC
jgi:Uma2 family endonuclease